MQNDDVQLIQGSLAGDENAFTTLVRKYQKQVHALAWRKVGNFHVAEEITQDTFLKVYKKLSTLKDPYRFPGWLYRIAARQCIVSLRKKKMPTQSIENTNIKQIEKMPYSQYIAEEQAKAATEAQREIVQKLLARLQESERTVVTLHYFGEMTCEEISRFLGISPSTVKSRLHRARHRLKRAEPMIREALEGFQIRANLTENIMQKIPHINPTIPSSSKPLVPWAIAASTVALVIMSLGIGNQYLTRFQQPYDLDATSEMTVELIDASTVLDLASKPDVRTQLGRTIIPSRGNKSEPDVVQSEQVARLFRSQQKNVILNHEKSSQEIINVFRTPTPNHQDYTVVEIDATAFKNGGLIIIDIWVGSADAPGAFILFANNSAFSIDGIPETVLASVSGIPPGKSARIQHHFKKDSIFKLGAIGNAFTGNRKANSFLANISINTKPKMLE